MRQTEDAERGTGGRFLQEAYSSFRQKDTTGPDLLGVPWTTKAPIDLVLIAPDCTLIGFEPVDLRFRGLDELLVCVAVTSGSPGQALHDCEGRTRAVRERAAGGKSPSRLA